MYLFVVYEIFISIFIDVMFYNMVAFTTNYYYYYYMRFSFRYSYACLVIKLFLFFKCLIFLSIDFNGSCGTAIERLISAAQWLRDYSIERSIYVIEWLISVIDLYSFSSCGLRKLWMNPSAILEAVFFLGLELWLEKLAFLGSVHMDSGCDYLVDILTAAILCGYHTTNLLRLGFLLTWAHKL